IAPGPVGGAGGVALGLPPVWWDRSLLVCNGPWMGLVVPGTAPALGSRWRLAASPLSHVLLTADDGSVSRSCGRRRYDGRQGSAGGRQPPLIAVRITSSAPGGSGASKPTRSPSRKTLMWRRIAG